jgi:hypothetical protein
MFNEIVEGLGLKKRTSILLIGVVSILMLSAASTSNAPIAVDFSTGRFSDSIPAGLIWSENFDDGNISEWNIYGINATGPLPDELCIGNFSLDGGVMRATGEEWNIASHNSTVAYGTWSFDMDVQIPEDETHYIVAFIQYHFSQRDLNEGRLSPGYALGFYFTIGGNQEIRLIRGSHDLSPKALFLDYYYSQDITGWKHFIVTREPSGQFYVYMNGTLILGGKNTDYTTCERFSFSTHANPAIDNIVVDNNVIYDGAPPEIEPQIPNSITITEGESFFYNVNATDFSGIDSWWIDDTENFTIDEEGVITNNTALSLGDYSIGVWVNDTLGNTQQASFGLSVVPSTSSEFSLPIEIILAVGGGAIIIIIVLVFLTRRKS